MGCISSKKSTISPISDYTSRREKVDWCSYDIAHEYHYYYKYIGDYNKLTIPLKNLITLIHILNSENGLNILLTLNHENYYIFLLTLWKKIELYKKYKLSVHTIIEILVQISSDKSLIYLRSLNLESLIEQININIENQLYFPGCFDNVMKELLKEIYWKIYIPFQHSESIKKFNLDYIKAHNILIYDFDIIKKLGQGGFSKVYLVKKKTTKKLYALKTIQKNVLLNSYRHDFWRSFLELKITSTVTSPFISRCKYAFHTQQYVFIAMELGVDLIKVSYEFPYNRLPIELMRFYAAEILLALEYLHEIGIIYRDLKPSNVIITRNGHVKLIDLGGAYVLNYDKVNWKEDIEIIKAKNYIKEFDLNTNPLDIIRDDNKYKKYKFYKWWLKENEKEIEEEKLKKNNSLKEYISRLNHNIKFGSSNSSTVKSNRETYSITFKNRVDLSYSNTKNFHHNTLKRNGSILGTFGYMAPEMVFHKISKKLGNENYLYDEEVKEGDDSSSDNNNNNNNKENITYDDRVDFYSLGATLYRCVVGHKLYEKNIEIDALVKDIDQDKNQFLNMNIDPLGKNITNSKNTNIKNLDILDPEDKWEKLYHLQQNNTTIEYPDDVDHDFINLVNSLLTSNVNKRLGVYHDQRNIKEHEFFQGIDWDALSKLELNPPLIPNICKEYENLSYDHHHIHSINQEIYNSIQISENVEIKYDFFDTFIHVANDCINNEIEIQLNYGCLACCHAPAMCPLCSLLPCCKQPAYIHKEIEASKYIHLRENSIEWNHPYRTNKEGMMCGYDCWLFRAQDNVQVIYFDDPMMDTVSNDTMCCNSCVQFFCGGSGQVVRIESTCCFNMCARTACCCIYAPICFPDFMCPCALKHRLHVKDADKAVYEIKQARDSARQRLG